MKFWLKIKSRLTSQEPQKNPKDNLFWSQSTSCACSIQINCFLFQNIDPCSREDAKPGSSVIEEAVRMVRECEVLVILISQHHDAVMEMVISMCDNYKINRNIHMFCLDSVTPLWKWSKRSVQTLNNTISSDLILAVASQFQWKLNALKPLWFKFQIVIPVLAAGQCDLDLGHRSPGLRCQRYWPITDQFTEILTNHRPVSRSRDNSQPIRG